MIFRKSRSAAADRHGVRDALVRLRATIAVLDEELRAPVTPLPRDLVGLLRPDLDVPAAMRDLERELAILVLQAESLRRRRDEELELRAAWSSRQQLSESEDRPDLAAQAGMREAEHKRNADELTREIGEFEALARDYTAVLVALRRRAVDDASKAPPRSRTIS